MKPLFCGFCACVTGHGVNRNGNELRNYFCFLLFFSPLSVKLKIAFFFAASWHHGKDKFMFVSGQGGGGRQCGGNLLKQMSTDDNAALAQRVGAEFIEITAMQY